MPIFEYKCNNCGQVMEFLEKTKDSQKHVCEKCGGSNLQKMLSDFAVGRSKSTSPACETCPGGQCQINTCTTGDCPYN